MDEKQCKTCHYYLQHYILERSKLIRIYCGHCTFLRPKHKKPDAKACEHYIPGSTREDTFATKEYLSKALLQYVLGMDLLPEIESE